MSEGRRAPSHVSPRWRLPVAGLTGLLVVLGCPAESIPQTAIVDSATLRAMQASMPTPGTRRDSIPRDSIAELPRATVDARYVPPNGATIRVGPSDDLQRALDRAKPGDIVRLASGATYVGNFVLPKKPCGATPTVVRSDVADSLLPPEGTRITPTFAPRLAKIATRNSRPALHATSPTCGWRLLGLEVTATPELTKQVVNYGLLTLGDGGSVSNDEAQTSLERVPIRIVLDRMYVHGLPTTNSVRCIAMNSAYTAIVSSWISECHAKGFDSQAVEGWNGPGPFLIENNFLSGAGENVMFGGADPGIHDLSPSDITIRGNHVYKDPAWKGVWTVKNLFELKNARRVLVENNVFENNWIDGQAGMAIVIKSSQDACGSCTWEGTTDVTFRYNHVKNSPRGFNAQAVDCSGQACVDVHVQRVLVENNLFENIGSFNGSTGDGWLVLLTHDLHDIAIRHNTFVSNLRDRGTAIVMDYGNGQARRLTITDNVFASPVGYALFYSDTRVGTNSLRAMAGDSWTFVRNVVGGIDPQFAPWHPPGNWYPPTVAQIAFVDPVGGDYRLSAKSDFKQHGAAGTDPGADLNTLRRRIDGVVVR